MSILDSIKTHFQERGIDLEPDEDLFASGQVDSVSMMEAIVYMEKQFAVVIPEEELVPDNFRSLTVIAGYIERKTSQP